MTPARDTKKARGEADQYDILAFFTEDELLTLRAGASLTP